MRLASAAALGAVLVAAPAAAKPVTTQSDGVAVDWSRGVLVARAGAAADLRAPSAEIARVKAERVAKRRAAATLARGAAALPRAPGLEAPDADRVAGEAIVTDVKYASDGSVIVEMVLPLEAIRRRLLGASKPPAGQGGPTALVIDASSTSLRPALGYRLRAGGQRYAGPILLFRDRQALAADRRLGPRPRRLAAEGLEGADIVLDARAAPLVVAARAAAAPVFVLIK